MKRFLHTVIGLLPFLLAAQTGKLPVIQQTQFKKDSFNIVKFGAIPDGNTLNTKSITAAIDACSKKGGGVVLVPSGLWLTGPIVLKSNINLHLASGATLLFTKDHSQYPLVKANWEGIPQMRNQSPVSATNAVNVGITGSGIIDGNGDSWRAVKKDKMTESQWAKLLSSGGIASEDKKTWYPSEGFMKGSKMSNPGAISADKDETFYNSIKEFLRPNLLLFTSCNKVLLEGVTFQNSPAWCLHPLMCENLTVRNVRVKNPWYAQNGDGIDAESCKNVLIENSVFDVGDDALCMKSGRDAEGRKRGMPIENVIIRGCTVYAAHGGFVIGSEMSGGARNIFVNNCTFIGTDIGLRFKTTRGRGGVVENIFIKDIYMKDIPGEAILFDMYYMAKDPVPMAGEKRELPKVEFKEVNETTPVFKNFHISNVYCNGAEKAIFVRGLPEMHVKEVVLENMVMQAKKGIDVQEATGITFRNISVLSDDTDPVIDVIHSDKLVFDNIRYKDGSELLFRVGGERSNNITIRNTDASKAKEKIVYELGATEKSVSLSSKPAPIPGDLNVPASAWSERMVATAMKLWPDSFSNGGRRARWSYDHGVILRGVEGLWNNTGKGKYFNYIQHTMDHYVHEDGTIYDYTGTEYNIDYVNNGKLVLLLYEITGQAKYKKAADLLRNQLRTHPRTHEGGFWHKKIYPWQMWLDGLYMGAPFYAQYSRVFHDDTAFNDITNQFIYVERHTRDPKTGLLYHGWDESKEQQWANKETGVSPHFWGRAMGWYGMAMVDVLDQYPAKHPGRDSIIKILNRFAQAVIKVQDAKSGLWYDIVDLPDRPKNYKEASASCMLVYTLLKGVRKGYLPASYLANAKRGYNGIITEFIETDANGQTNLKGTVSVSGLGGNPYRDGSYDYYMKEPVVVNDPKGMGAFIQCANEMAIASEPKPGKGKTVLLDRYFNSEKKKDELGVNDYWHYVWEGKGHPGLTMWGNNFTKFGASLSSLDVAPTPGNLARASVYIIIDPDHVKDNPSPNYVSATDVKAISDWVKLGGVLVLMANDSANCDLSHFNKLANVFGINFSDKSRNMVKGDDFPTGEVHASNKTVFKEDVKMYLKEVSVLNLKAPATAVASREGDVIMATAKYGKGTVFAVGDPWLYNEYTDGRKLPEDYDNYAAAEMLSNWLLQQSKK